MIPSDIQELISEKRFLEWVRERSGNVYQLLEDFIKATYPTVHITVGPGWLAWEPKLEWVDHCWNTYEKLPAWFRRWISENATGKFKTNYGVVQ